MSSVCPGFVCYAEKTHGQLIVPLLSRVKSAQQVMGILVKRFLQERGLDATNAYHTTVMPCYDKKLEATRNGSDLDKEVDLVLTPIEIEVMLNNENVNISEVIPRKLDSITEEPNGRQLVSHLGSGSGGYTENVFRFIASKLFTQYYKSDQQLNYKTVRNKDFIELTLEDESGSKLLSFAIVNGFRNIQTIVQRIKRKSSHYHYVEVMACPSGCLNGGAQLRPHSKGEPILEKVETLYNSIPISKLAIDPEDKVIIGLYEKFFGSETNSKLYTTFKAVPKTLNLITANW